jgi:hypothetical protein
MNESRIVDGKSPNIVINIGNFSPLQDSNIVITFLAIKTEEGGLSPFQVLFDSIEPSPRLMMAHDHKGVATSGD